MRHDTISSHDKQGLTPPQVPGMLICRCDYPGVGWAGFCAHAVQFFPITIFFSFSQGNRAPWGQAAHAPGWR